VGWKVVHLLQIDHSMQTRNIAIFVLVQCAVSKVASEYSRRTCRTTTTPRLLRSYGFAQSMTRVRHKLEVPPRQAEGLRALRNICGLHTEVDRKPIASMRLAARWRWAQLRFVRNMAGNARLENGTVLVNFIWSELAAANQQERRTLSVHCTIFMTLKFAAIPVAGTKYINTRGTILANRATIGGFVDTRDVIFSRSREGR
jgi:hypothetical protein